MPPLDLKNCFSALKLCHKILKVIHPLTINIKLFTQINIKCLSKSK